MSGHVNADRCYKAYVIRYKYNVDIVIHSAQISSSAAYLSLRVHRPLAVSVFILSCQDSTADEMSLTDQLAFFEMEADAIKKVFFYLKAVAINYFSFSFFVLFIPSSSGGIAVWACLINTCRFTALLYIFTNVCIASGDIMTFCPSC